MVAVGVSRRMFDAPRLRAWRNSARTTEVASEPGGPERRSMGRYYCRCKLGQVSRGIHTSRAALSKTDIEALTGGTERSSHVGQVGNLLRVVNPPHPSAITNRAHGRKPLRCHAWALGERAVS